MLLHVCYITSTCDEVYLIQNGGNVIDICFQATGCEADFHFEDTPYYPMEHNRKLGEIYKEQAMSLGMSFDETYAAQEMHIGKL